MRLKIDYGIWDFSKREKLFLLSGCLLGGNFLGWLFFNEILLGAVLGVGGYTFLKRGYCDWMIRKRKNRLLLQFQDLLYSLSSSVSLGRSMGQALKESYVFWEHTYDPGEDIMVELKQMIVSMEMGNESELILLEDFAKRSGLHDISDFVMVYGCCRESGGNLVKAMNRAARMIGDKISLERELQSLLAQKQFEGRIIMAAPILILLLLKIMAPEYLEGLTGSATGYLISGLALVLIGVSIVFMERVNHIDF